MTRSFALHNGRVAVSSAWGLIWLHVLFPCVPKQNTESKLGLITIICMIPLVSHGIYRRASNRGFKLRCRPAAWADGDNSQRTTAAELIGFRNQRHIHRFCRAVARLRGLEPHRLQDVVAMCLQSSWQRLQDPIRRRALWDIKTASTSSSLCSWHLVQHQRQHSQHGPLHSQNATNHLKPSNHPKASDMASLTGKEYSVYRTIDGKIISDTVTIPELGPFDVLLRVTHSGVCYTDFEFSRLGAPLALGHEGAGVVEAVGASVTTLKVGDRAGGGFHKSSCGTCNYCLTGRDIQCYQRTVFGTGDYNNGTFGAYYVGKEGYLHKTPDGLASEDAAPLQCAGATVYTALTETITSRDRVGIVGIGGLGHLAIQIAAKMGAEVVVFSTSKDKEQEALGFGASEFVLLSEPEKVKAPVSSLILTGSKYPDWNKFLSNTILARGGTIVPLAAPTNGPITLPADKLFWESYHVHSSLVASKAQHDEMLNFAARHKIKPAIQVHKFEGPETINAIFSDLENNKVRYRAVLEF